MRRLRRTVLVLVALALTVLLVQQCTRPQHQAEPEPHSAVPTSTQPTVTAAPSTPAPTTSGARTTTPAATTATTVQSPANGRVVASPSLPPGATIDEEGFVRANFTATGKYRPSSLSLGDSTAPHRWILQVESSVPDADVNATARQMQQILDHPRSWRGVTSGAGSGARFQLVSDPRRATLVIRLASAETVNRLCPLNTRDLWSCATGPEVLVTADRWLFATPAYVGQTLADYRAYLINHEVGHILGRDHVSCPGRGELAPVMMQQSKDLLGCTPNPWPTPP